MQVSRISNKEYLCSTQNNGISFSGYCINWLKAGSLTDNELNIVRHIRECFDGASSVYTKMNGISQREFRKFYPDLDSVKNTKGFVFRTEYGDKLQLQKINTRETSNELLTFSVWDDKNALKAHFKVNTNGDYFISNKKFSKDIISEDKQKNLEHIDKEMSILNKYAQNFVKIYRKIVRSKGEPLSAKQIIARMDDINSFEGYNKEANSLLEKFHRVNKLLNKNQSQVTPLKEEFFSGYSKKSKGWPFLAPDGSRIVLTPSFQKDMDSLFLITKIDKSGNKKVFVFFADGKIASPLKVGNRSFVDIRSYNLDFLTKEDIEKNQMKETLQFLDNKIDEFESFIIEKRQRVPKQMSAHKQKVHHQARCKARPVINGMRADKAAGKNTRVSSDMEFVSKYNLREENALEEITEDLNAILNTPVLQRSPHLVHEKFPDGRIFEGRFQMKASDGANVMVSRVKSSRFYDFSYISVRITNPDGTKHVMNIDPSRMKIIDSVDGKPILDRYRQMRFYTPLGFLRKNPWAVDIPKYIEEIVTVKKGAKAKFVEIKKPKKTQAELLADAEKEVQRALRQFEKDDDFFSNF